MKLFSGDKKDLDMLYHNFCTQQRGSARKIQSGRNFHEHQKGALLNFW